MKVYYQNSSGRRFTLYGDGLSYIDPMELHTFGWSYTLSNNLSGQGSVASNFARYARTFELELRMRGYSVQEFLTQVNTLHDITEADVCAAQPGRLYVDEQYLTCYLTVAGDEPRHPRGTPWMTRTVTVLAVEPYWCTPVTVNLAPPPPEGTGTVMEKVDPARYGGFTLYGGAYPAALRWSFTNSEAVQPSSGTYYYAVYELPQGTTKVGFTGYHYNSNYAGCGFYAGVPGVGEKLWSYTAANNTKIDTPTEVDVPATATHMVIQLGNGLGRGLYLMTTGGKKFDLRYAYRYGTGMGGSVINNTHYSAVPMIITIFGAAESPVITIDGVQYGANVTLTSTDRLVIDQIHSTVYTVSETGVRTSVFDQRIKTSNVFAPLPTGSHTVIYSGDYTAQITMIYQRSELKWTA